VSSGKITSCHLKHDGGGGGHFYVGVKYSVSCHVPRSVKTEHLWLNCTVLYCHLVDRRTSHNDMIDSQCVCGGGEGGAQMHREAAVHRCIERLRCTTL